MDGVTILSQRPAMVPPRRGSCRSPSPTKPRPAKAAKDDGKERRLVSPALSPPPVTPSQGRGYYLPSPGSRRSPSTATPRRTPSTSPDLLSPLPAEASTPTPAPAPARDAEHRLRRELFDTLSTQRRAVVDAKPEVVDHSATVARLEAELSAATTAAALWEAQCRRATTDAAEWRRQCDAQAEREVAASAAHSAEVEKLRQRVAALEHDASLRAEQAPVVSSTAPPEMAVRELRLALRAKDAELRRALGTDDAATPQRPTFTGAARLLVAPEEATGAQRSFAARLMARIDAELSQQRMAQQGPQRAPPLHAAASHHDCTVSSSSAPGRTASLDVTLSPAHTTVDDAAIAIVIDETISEPSLEVLHDG